SGNSLSSTDSGNSQSSTTASSTVSETVIPSTHPTSPSTSAPIASQLDSSFLMTPTAKKAPFDSSVSTILLSQEETKQESNDRELAQEEKVENPFSDQPPDRPIRSWGYSNNQNCAWNVSLNVIAAIRRRLPTVFDGEDSEGLKMVADALSSMKKGDFTKLLQRDRITNKLPVGDARQYLYSLTTELARTNNETPPKLGVQQRVSTFWSLLARRLKSNGEF